MTAVLALLGCSNQPAVAAAVTHKAVDQALVAKEGIAVPGKLVRALHISDAAGEHILVVSALTGPSRKDPDYDKGRTDLDASYYSRSATRWVREWAIKDGVDCPVVDHEARFFPDQLSVTDLDKNGMAEVTVAYKIFCGGGIDEAVLKVILRQGEQKFAMRGTTRLEMPDGDSFGGAATYDKALSLPANAAFKKHIAAIRAKVVTTKY